MKDKKAKKQNVLIIGDWVVDEYWFVARHRSEISSHTGFNHYRIISEPDAYVSALCGAGEIAQILYHLGKIEENPNERPYDLTGVGRWNGEDEDYIKHLIHSHRKAASEGCPAGKTRSGVLHKWCQQEPKICLNNLDESSPTIRVIRQYHQDGNELKQISRVDWEPKPEDRGNHINLEAWADSLPMSVDHIVVHDLFKGTVSDDLVRIINEKYPHAKWYVRSKQESPEWLNHIKDNLILLMIGPEVAELLTPWRSWLAKEGISNTALGIVNKMPGYHVVLLSERRDVIARFNAISTTDPNSTSVYCVTAKASAGSSPLATLGWPSAVFGYLIYKLILKDTEPKPYLSETELSEALKWANENGGVSSPRAKDVSVSTAQHSFAKTLSWERVVKDWASAKEGLGLITDPSNGSQKLEVWRGSTHLPGYVVHIAKKQEIVDRIGRRMLAFVRESSPKRSLSIMLQADPGAGKTHLAKTLANIFDTIFLPIDMTQLTHREDLLDLFDTITNTQAQETKPILVFVDEINAFLDANNVYGPFLAPLEEGYYLRRGKRFSLRPCIWIFAGTELEADTVKKGEKLSDFKSRMTLIEKIDYKSLKDVYGQSNLGNLDEEARLEQVYLGAIMLRNFVPDVTKVDYEILDYFHKMDPADSPARKIRKCAMLMNNVQYGTIETKNCMNWGVKWGKTPKETVELEY